MKLIYTLVSIYWFAMIGALAVGYNPDKITVGVAFFVTGIAILSWGLDR